MARSREKQKGEPVNRRRKWRNTNCIKRGSEAVVAKGRGEEDLAPSGAQR